MILPPKVPPNWLRFSESRAGCKSRHAIRARVEVAVAKVFEEVAVIRIAARLGHDIDHAAGMQPVLRRQAVGLHVEFLDRVRERNRHVHVAERVVVIAAIQQEVHAVGLRAGHRKLAGAIGSLHVLAAREVAAIQRHGGRAARERQQLRRVAAVQRQVLNALLVDHLGDRILLGLHHRGVRRHLQYSRSPNRSAA